METMTELREKYEPEKRKPVNPKRKTQRRNRETPLHTLSIRMQMYARSGGMCESRVSPCCWISASWYAGQAAHIKSRGAGGAFELNNLLWLCPACHQWQHNDGKPIP